MLNLAGSSFDFGQVLFAILTECEHRRRSLAPGEAETKLLEAAREKLAEIHESYAECGGTEDYFAELTREVMETALPRYLPRAVEQTRREREGYDLWRGGDPVARAGFALIGLVLGGIIVAVPFIPIEQDVFAFLLALAGLFFPEITRLFFDQRHSRFLNRLIREAERYQKDRRVHYVSSSELDTALSTVFEGSQGNAEEAKSAAVAAETPAPPVPTISPERSQETARRHPPRAKTLGH